MKGMHEDMERRLNEVYLNMHYMAKQGRHDERIALLDALQAMEWYDHVSDDAYHGRMWTVRMIADLTPGALDGRHSELIEQAKRVIPPIAVMDE